jgi:hypothetical protein
MINIEKKELDILENITNYSKNLDILDKKIRILKNINDDKFYKNILLHSSESLKINTNRNEIINSYLNELYKRNDKFYKLQSKIEDKIKDNNLNININEKVNIIENSNYNFNIINNDELNKIILDADNKINMNEIIKKKDFNIIFFENNRKILDLLKNKIRENNFNKSIRIINNDNDKLDLLNYNLNKLIENKVNIGKINNEEFSDIKKGGNKFNINIETNLFLLKENIINILDTYNNLSKYNNIIKREDELINEIDYYKYIFFYYKFLITNETFIKKIETADTILNLLTFDYALLDLLKNEHKENKTLKTILDKYKFEKDKKYLTLTNNLDLAYLRGFILNKISK